MKVLYDFQAFSMQKFGGVSNSFVELIAHLPDKVEYKIALRESDNIHLWRANLISDLVNNKNGEDTFIRNRNFKGRRFLYSKLTQVLPSFTSTGRNMLYSIEELKNKNFDIFHPTFFNPYFLKYLNNKPFVLTVHDMIPEIMYSYRDKQAIDKQLLVEHADHIVAVSEQTKSDLINILNVDKNKVSVIYHGTPEYDSISSKPLINTKYLLYVGSRQMDYKNFIPMLLEIEQFFREVPDIILVCAGPQFSKKEKEFISKLKIENRVICITPNDKDMCNLFQNATCFIYPSLYEGFGIPILEAFKAKCPVLLNKKSCFPEIAGDAAIYFNLDPSLSNLKEVLLHFVTSPKEKINELINKEQKQMQLYSWKRSSELLYDIYSKVIFERNCK